MPIVSTANISVDVPFADDATIRIVDLNGFETHRVFKGELKAGTITLPLTTDRLASGTYVIHVNLDGFTYAKVIQVLR